MKNVLRALACAGAMVAAVSVAPGASAVVDGDSQGCTPGYWKQKKHFDSWQEAAPSDLFKVRFGLGSSTPRALKGVTMLQALGGGGGAGLDGARKILARAATAAYLNAAYDNADGTAMLYPWRRQDTGFNGEPALVPTVKAAITGKDRQRMLELAKRLDAANNLGCPLS